MREEPTQDKVGIDGCEDAWVCPCGNTPHGQGFHPWPYPDQDSDIYRCDRCGRLVHCKTRKILGFNNPDSFERYMAGEYKQEDQ
jgi:hypothetical protein